MDVTLGFTRNKEGPHQKIQTEASNFQSSFRMNMKYAITKITKTSPWERGF
jgi:hypothetical protein